jgi:membrane-associated phospholipid phosphatase
MTSSLARRFEKQIRFLQKRLSPEGYAGLHLTIGILVVLLCGWGFGAIAEDVSENDPIVHVDQQVAVWFHQHATSMLVDVARAISFFGSVGWLTAASIVVAVVFIRRRDYRSVLLLTVTMIGGSGLNVLLKHFFHRERPALENPLVTLSSFGFPSGHTMGATLFYGLLALVAWQNIRRRTARLGVLFAAGMSILLIGFTRIYLGAHYVSDVTGALFAGALWLVVCWTGFETLRRRRSLRL